jgi:hypothetical protein
MKKALVGFVCLFSVVSSAAPFCVQSTFGTNCWYYNRSSCEEAAASNDGLCVMNAREENSGPSGDAPFCVRTSASVNCWYYSASECRRAARSADGACFPNPRR